MALEKVKEYLKQWNRTKDIIELDNSSATVELAAKALQIDGKRIAKKLSFKVYDNAILVVCVGDAKIDNHKFKTTFGVKASMLKGEEVEKYTNHTIGGVCPFAIPESTKVYLDRSMKRFTTVYPACGSANSAIELNLEELAQYSRSEKWVDVCKNWEDKE